MFEGKIVVEGATMQILPSGEPTDEFAGGKKAEERVYVYDPAASAWSQASNMGMVPGQTILNNDGQLMLVGGLYETYSPDDPDTPIPSDAPAFNYSLDAGAFEELCPLNGLMVNPQAVARNGVIYLYNGHSYDLAMVKDGKSSMCQQMLPELAFDTSDGLSNLQIREDPVIGWGVLANASEGIIFMGLPAADGSTETYILRDGEQKFESYEKRASEDRVYNPAACTYRGRLFVIGSAWFEPDQRIFRATAIDVPEYPGDIPCDEDPAPEPPTPAPPAPEPPTPVTPVAPSKPASKPSSSSTGKTTSKALPKTGDDAPYVTVVTAAAFGALALGLGLHERGRMTRRVS